MSEFDQLVSIVNASCEHGCTIEQNSTPKALRINAADLLKVCTQLQQNPTSYFDMLVNVTAVDNGVEKGTIDVVYHLTSIPYNFQLALIVTISRGNPEVESVSHIWKSANWHEREAYDLLGIKFLNHPDLRRILLPADWNGYPLRKDYKHEEYYRNIKIEY